MLRLRPTWQLSTGRFARMMMRIRRPKPMRPKSNRRRDGRLPCPFGDTRGHLTRKGMTHVSGGGENIDTIGTGTWP